MSWTTGTQTETLGANSAVGTSLNTFTSAAASSPPTGAAYLPANFFLPSYGIGKSLLVKASGIISTVSAPTMAWGVTANTTLGTTTAGATLAVAQSVLGTTTLIAQASGTNMPWEMDLLITCVTTGTGATFISNGAVKVYTSSTAIQTMRISSSTANANTTTTIGASGTTVAYYIELAAACGTSSSSNIFQCYSYIVLGLN